MQLLLLRFYGRTGSGMTLERLARSQSTEQTFALASHHPLTVNGTPISSAGLACATRLASVSRPAILFGRMDHFLVAAGAISRSFDPSSRGDCHPVRWWRPTMAMPVNRQKYVRQAITFRGPIRERKSEREHVTRQSTDG